jgi:hypothetical protein
MATVRLRSTYAPDLFQLTSIPTVDSWQLQLSHFLSEIISQVFYLPKKFLQFEKICNYWAFVCSFTEIFLIFLEISVVKEAAALESFSEILGLLA